MNEFQLGIIGYPLAHSRSPELHNAALRFYDLGGRYEKLEIKPEMFETEISELKKKQIHGFNITVPYKRQIIPFLDDIDPLARQIGAVNTVHVKDGAWVGYNTDAAGFLYPLKNEKNLKNVLILGAGGAALAVCHALLNQFPNMELWIANRSENRLNQLQELLRCYFPIKNIHAIHPLSSIQMQDIPIGLIVNCTALGMAKNTSITPFDVRDLATTPKIVYDLIYNPPETEFLKLAKKAGAGRCINGWPMLVHQADRSFSIWTGKRFPKKFYVFSDDAGTAMR